ncbi:hypothetical protein SMICM17S_02279 [Streptomyces microflavus]
MLTEDVHTTGAAPERPRPAHAVLGGPLLALPQETPGGSATGVDLRSLDTPAQRLAAVLSELRAEGTPGRATSVAWRAGRRYDGGPAALPSAPLASRQSALDAPLTAALEKRAAAHGVSLFHLLLAAHVRCLGRRAASARSR